MPRHRRIVAWRTPADLLEVKTAFYPASNGEDLRPMALAKVRAWTSRTRIPHSIEATALLTEATLHDTPNHSSLNARLSYSTAICRFVNGLLDPAQQSQFAIPMHTLARNLNLPASFVEIRHAATHDMLPGLALLRAVAARALAWLWDNYWVSVGANWRVDVEGPGQQDVTLPKARMALKRWRQLRRENPRRPMKRVDKSAEGAEDRKILKECVDICRDEEGREALIEAFLEEKGLVPAGKKKAPLMTGALYLWRPLIDALDASINGFGAALLTAMLDVFSTPQPLFTTASEDSPEPTHTPEYMDSLLTWLTHFTSSNVEPKFLFGRQAMSSIDYEDLVRQVVLRPSEWGIKFFRHLLRERPALKTKYAAIADIAATQVLPPPPPPPKEGGRKRKIEEVEEELRGFEARTEELKRRRAALESGCPMEVAREAAPVKVGRWRKWSGEWTERPIGVL